MVSKSQAGLLTRPAGPWVMWPGAAGPCYSGSRCFIGISVGLALVGLPAAAGTTWVPDRSVCAPSVERGGGGNGWADGLTGGALRAGPALPTKNFRRAAPRAGLGRFHCHGREPNKAAIEANPNKLSASSGPRTASKGKWRKFAPFFYSRGSGRTAAGEQENSGPRRQGAVRRRSRRSGGAAGGGAGTGHGQRCVEGHGRAGRGPSQGSGTGDRGWVQEPRRRGAGAAPGGGLRWCPRLSAVLGRPHGGSGERRHDGSHQPARTWGRCGGWWGVRSGRRRWSPWGLLGPSQGWISPPSRSGCGVGSVARDGRRPGPGSKHLSGGPERPGEPVGRLFRAVKTTVGGNGGLKMALRAFDSGSGAREG